MDPMMKIINALAALTAALQELTQQTTDNYVATFETIYDPEKDEPTEEQPVVDNEKRFEALRSRLSEISRAGHTADIKVILRKYGAERISELKTDDYDAVMQEAEQYAN